MYKLIGVQELKLMMINYLFNFLLFFNLNCFFIMWDYMISIIYHFGYYLYYWKLFCFIGTARALAYYFALPLINMLYFYFLNQLSLFSFHSNGVYYFLFQRFWKYLYSNFILSFSFFRMQFILNLLILTNSF